MIAELEKSTADIQEMAERNERLIYLVLKDMKLLDKKEDYYGYGAIGLMKACKTFNSELGFKESGYLYRGIKMQILMQLREERKKTTPQNCISLEQEYNNGEDTNISLIDTIASDFDLEQKIIDKDFIEKLKLIIENLKDKEKIIIYRYFGIFGFEKRNIKQIANLLNMDRNSICRIKSRALNKIRRKLRYELYI